MRLDPDGAQRVPAAFAPNQISDLEQALAPAADSRPGIRLDPRHGLAGLVGPATSLATSILGPNARPVRAILFDKSPTRNWALGWHQDRTIAVRRRAEVTGFRDWTSKGGIPHVVPPAALLERMLTVRIHLDPVGPDNAPLLVVPCSHRLGIISEPEIPAIAARFGEAPSLAERGDMWLYATLILHASARAAIPSRRRVLQILYSADGLPDGLEWLGL